MQPREGRDRARATRVTPAPHPGWLHRRAVLSPERRPHARGAGRRRRTIVRPPRNLLEPFDSAAFLTTDPVESNSATVHLPCPRRTASTTRGSSMTRAAWPPSSGSTAAHPRRGRAGVEALRNMDHRGASGSDPETGDGAGILLQLPDAFFRRVVREELGIELPPPGHYAVGMAFLPRDPGCGCAARSCSCASAPRRATARSAGATCRALGPIGELARLSAPVVRQLFVERRGGDDEAFERKLAVIRRRVEKEARAGGVEDGRLLVRRPVVAHASSTRACCAPGQLDAYYPDLAAPDIASALVLVHSRFSTNTLGTWDLAHPFNLLCHNGEINTVRGNGAWLTRARAAAALRRVRRRPAEAVPDRRGALVRLRQARRDARAAGPRRPLAAARAGDADPARLDRPDARPRRRRARVPRVPRLAGRAVGRAGRAARLRRHAGRRDARPQRPAPRAACSAPATGWS